MAGFVMAGTDEQGVEVLADKIVELCQQAGDAIVSVYNSPQSLIIEQKTDDSPVTRADQLAHQLISEGLNRLTPGWPVLSEEQTAPPFAERCQWRRYWLVDPLDGTKEFIDHNGEFTVNIALINEGLPVLGVVYLPLDKTAYIGAQALGAWRQDQLGRTAIKVNRLNDTGRVKMLTSRRHKGPELAACIERLEQQFQAVERIKAGSALKFCRLAEGRGDIYPRFSPCSEWDTAAGQALLEAAGGQLVDMDFQRLRYNQRESLINPPFYALAAADFNWQRLLSVDSATG